MRKFLKWFTGIIVVLFLIYLAGPRPAKPEIKNNLYSFPVFLTDLETQINNEEKAVKGLKPDNEARIIWADSVNKEKTKIAFLYLHGFSASQGEGDPVHKDLAKKYNANLYLSRLYEHGIDRGDSTMIRLNAEDYIASAEKALAITKELGDEVIVIGTSAGGALTLFLASRHPEIKAIVLYSPCVRLYNKTSAILDKPWGLQIVRLINGGPVKRNKQDNKEEEKYWQPD
jgi:esterase/lipase